MAYSEMLGYFVLTAGFGLMCWKRSFSTVFVFACLIVWEIKDLGLDFLHITHPPQVAVIGLLIDFWLIIVITGCNLKSKIVLPALFVSMAYGVACLVENRMGGTAVLQIAYGWVTALIGLVILCGGIFNDPGGYRSIDRKSVV